MNDIITGMQAFLLRLPADLHARLKREAAGAGVSMNEYCVRKLAADTLASDAGTVIADARRVVGDALIGVVLFGSYARGSATRSSDVDVMLVVERSVVITRELYRRLDVAPRRLHDRAVDAHFSHLPDRRVGGGMWAEAAVDGIVLVDRDHRINATLAAIRRDLADGVLRRHTVHGQTYWTTAA